MKREYLLLLAVAVGLLALSLMVACGGDDDDDDDAAGGYSCESACDTVYDECGKSVWVDGVELTKSECVDGCEDEGGVTSCQGVCLDNYQLDGDCDELEECALGC